MMPSDVTFIVRWCARAACGDDVIIYDVRRQFSHFILVYIVVTH